MRALISGLILLGASVLLAWGTWLLRGAPEREVLCSAESLKNTEVCLADLPETGVLWVDTRSRTQWERDGVPGSLLLSAEAGENWDELLAEVATIILSELSYQMVVVYCDTAACGTSEVVAAQLRELGLGPEIRTLHGGWRALAAAGKIKDSSRGN